MIPVVVEHSSFLGSKTGSNCGQVEENMFPLLWMENKDRCARRSRARGEFWNQHPSVHHVMITIYAVASLYPYKKKRTKNTRTNTRQTDNDHPRRYLIWKDKIRYRPKHASITMTDQRPRAHRRWHHQAPEHEHTKEQHARKTEHLTQEHGPTQNNETNPTTRRTMTLHTQKETKVYPRPSTHTHDTQDKYLHIFHTVSSQSFTSLIPTEDLQDGHGYRPGYLTADKYPHLFHLSTMAV